MGVRRGCGWGYGEGEGGLGVVFSTPDAEASHALLGAAGLVAPENALRNLGRVIENGPDGGPVELAFRNVHLADGATPGIPAFLCQHLTPEKMRRPDWLAHPNTARCILSATIVVDDVNAATEALDGPQPMGSSRNRRRS